MSGKRAALCAAYWWPAKPSTIAMWYLELPVDAVHWQVTGLRYHHWKLVFMEQRVQGTLRVWAEPFTTLHILKIFNLRLDPYERADVISNTYYDWLMDQVFLLVPAQDYAGTFLMTFKDYPQRQKAASFMKSEAKKQNVWRQFLLMKQASSKSLTCSEKLCRNMRLL